MTQYALYNPLGYQQLSTTLTSAQPLPNIPTGARGVLLTVSVANVRWRDDGTAPTSTTGMLLTTTDEPFYYEGNLSKLQFIETATGALLDISYYAT